MPVHALFRDDDHFHGVIHELTADYMDGIDEADEQTDDAMHQVRTIMKAMDHNKISTTV